MVERNLVVGFGKPRVSGIYPIDRCGDFVLHLFYGRQMKEKVCKGCGISFTPRLSRNIYCSVECMRAYLKKNRVGFYLPVFKYK